MLFRLDCFKNSFFVFLLFLFCLHIFFFLSFKNMGWKVILILIKLFCISEILYIFKWRVGTVQTFSKTEKVFVKMFRMGRTKKYRIFQKYILDIFKTYLFSNLLYTKFKSVLHFYWYNQKENHL